MGWCTPSVWICYKYYNWYFYRFCSILYIIWYSSCFTHRSCFAGSSYECSYFPCCKYETDCAGSSCHYFKGTTGLEISLWLSPYHCGVSSRRCCSLEHPLPSHCGLAKVNATFCRTILHCMEDQQADIWSLASSNHGINSPGFPCVSTKSVSHGYWRVTRTYLH